MKFQNVAFEFAAGNLSQLPESTLPEIVFSGRSNVGKSSLINKLVGRKSIARVSATPGKTGTINFYRLPEVRLVDLPGYGYAKVSFSEKKRWANLVEGYLNSERNLRLVVQIVDMRHPPSKDDMQMIEYLHTSGVSFIIVLTKSDKLNKTKRLQRIEALKEDLEAYKEVKLIPFSSINAEGVEELRELISSVVE